MGGRQSHRPQASSKKQTTVRFLLHLTMQVHRGTDQSCDFLKPFVCYHLLCDHGNLSNCLHLAGVHQQAPATVG